MAAGRNKYSNEQLRVAIMVMDFTLITPPVVGRLVDSNLYPTVEEGDALKSFEGDEKMLNKVEKYLRELVSATHPHTHDGRGASSVALCALQPHERRHHTHQVPWWPFGLLPTQSCTCVRVTGWEQGGSWLLYCVCFDVPGVGSAVGCGG